MDKRYKKVLRILKELGIYKRYIIYLSKASNIYSGKAVLKRFLDNETELHVSRILDYTLTWSDTKEGRNFWREKNFAFEHEYLTYGEN